MSDCLTYRDYQNRVFEEANKTIKGQDVALKELISILQLNDIWHGLKEDGVGQKITVLLHGPTGCGKTFMVHHLINDILGWNLIHVDAQHICPTGWDGAEEFGKLLKSQYNSLNIKPGESHRPVVFFIDEIDKILFNENDRNYTMLRQSTLLNFIEGSFEPYSNIDTTDFIFILAGSFMEHKNRLVTNNYGFAVNLKETQGFNLEAAGLMEELVGRIHYNIALNPLDFNNLVDIAVLPGGIVSQIETALADMLSIDEIKDVCKKAFDTNKGGRGLTQAFVSEYVNLSLRRKERKSSEEIYDDEVRLNPWKIKLG